jgi:hypothetical protein
MHGYSSDTVAGAGAGTGSAVVDGDVDIKVSVDVDASVNVAKCTLAEFWNRQENDDGAGCDGTDETRHPSFHFHLWLTTDAPALAKSRSNFHASAFVHALRGCQN